MSIRREDPRARPARFFRFHASSVSLSADIDVEGAPTLRYAGPAVALPTVGGSYKAQAKRNRAPISRYLTHADAAATVKGTIDGGNKAQSTARASVKGVRVLGPAAILEIDSIEAVTTSERDLSTPDSCNLFTQTVNYGPIRVTAGGQVIVIKPQVDDVFCRIPTLRDLEAHYAKSKVAKPYGRFVGGLADEHPGSGIPRIDGTWVACSIVKSLDVDGRNVRGHIYSHPGFGDIAFGEMLIQEGHRWLSGARLTLCGPCKPRLVMAAIDHNSNSGG